MQIDSISRLPQETLCAIFHITRLLDGIPNGLAQFASYLRKKDLPLREKLAWVSLTHVCARWRALALGDPHMWTDVPVVLGRKWMYEFIERSRGLPFDVDNTGSTTTMYKFRKEIVPLYHQRMRNVRIWLGPQDPLSALLARPWPELVDLEVNFERNLNMQSLLGGHAPRLRFLRLRELPDSGGGSALSWQAPFLGTCTLVKLNVEIRGNISAASLADFVEALGRMTQLEHLRFIGQHSCSPAQCASCRPGRSHPCGGSLKSIELECNWIMATCMCKHLSPPPDIRISFNIGNDPFRDDRPDELLQIDLRSICTHIREWRREQENSPYDVEHLGALPYTAFELSDERCSHFVVHAASSSIFRPIGHWDQGVKGVHGDLRITLPHPYFDLNGRFAAIALATISELLASPSTRYLTHNSTSSLLNGLTPSIFPNITVLRLSRPCWSEISCINRMYDTGIQDDNSTNTHNAVGSTGSSLLFPALKILDLEQCLINTYTERMFVDGLKKTLLTRNSAVEVVCSKFLVYINIAENNAVAHTSDMFESLAPVTDAAIFNELRSPQVKIIGAGDASGQQERLRAYQQGAAQL